MGGREKETDRPPYETLRLSSASGNNENTQHCIQVKSYVVFLACSSWNIKLVWSVTAQSSGAPSGSLRCTRKKNKIATLRLISTCTNPARSAVCSHGQQKTKNKHLPILIWLGNPANDLSKSHSRNKTTRCAIFFSSSLSSDLSVQLLKRVCLCRFICSGWKAGHDGYPVERWWSLTVRQLGSLRCSPAAEQLRERLRERERARARERREGVGWCGGGGGGGEGADLNSDWTRGGGPMLVKLDLTLNKKYNINK